jgi:hypothetical protein
MDSKTKQQQQLQYDLLQSKQRNNQPKKDCSSKPAQKKNCSTHTIA